MTQTVSNSLTKRKPTVLFLSWICLSTASQTRLSKSKYAASLHIRINTYTSSLTIRYTTVWCCEDFDHHHHRRRFCVYLQRWPADITMLKVLGSVRNLCEWKRFQMSSEGCRCGLATNLIWKAVSGSRSCLMYRKDTLVSTEDDKNTEELHIGVLNWWWWWWWLGMHWRAAAIQSGFSTKWSTTNVRKGKRQ